MSAFYSFAYPDRVHVLADGGLFDDDGVLQRVERKIFAFHGLPVVVTGRGASASLVFEIIGDLVATVGQIARFDDAAAALSIVGSFFRNLGTRHASLDVEFLIAAYSALEGPQHFIVPCHDRYGLRPFDMASPGWQIGAGPAIGLDDLQHAGISADAVASPDFPERYGLEIMAAMRRKPACLPGSDRAFHAVGGRCDLATVSAGGVAIRMLGRWDDQPGKLIDPRTAAAPLSKASAA